MGAGVLYHLAREGWTDCVLIEKAELTSGATWHAAGLVSRMVGGPALGAIHDYAVDCYKSIEQETSQSVSWHGCGSLRVATSADHLDWIHHLCDAVQGRGQEAVMLGPKEVADLNPLYDTRAAGVVAGIYTPDDGHVDPAGACLALANGARQMGAEVIRHCRVTGIRQLKNREWAVDTEKGRVIGEHVVNAGGYHARQIGAFSGFDLPIVTLQHHYVVTDDVPEFNDMNHEIPVTRDDYFCGYLRREQKSVLIGIYDKQAPQAVWLEGCPWDSENELFDPNLDAISPWLENCFQRYPVLTDRGIKRIVNGGITYTPDGAMLLGPAPGHPNYWLACGATVGIAWGPGAGRALAQWIVHGSADISTRAFDPRRFGGWLDAEYTRARAIEDYTIRQALPYPQHQRQACRGVRVSGVHAQAQALGALFEEVGGWERPRVYAPDEPLAWQRTKIFDIVAEECRAVRERVGLGDFSAFAKFELEGAGAEPFLDAVCANRIPRKVGGTCLTLMLNRRGTIEGEAIIVRTGQDCFYLVVGAVSEQRLWDWLTIHCGVPMIKAELVNRTGEVGVLTLAGPAARDVLAACTSDDVSTGNFRWRQARELSIAGVRCLALRLSFTGELAWELHAANDRLSEVWTALWTAGQPYRMAAFGSKALDSLRLEKYYRGGHELANDTCHKDIGQMRFARLDKDFVGKQAMLARESSSKITLLALDDAETECLGGEAVFVGHDLVGSVTSAAYGHSVGTSLAIAFVKNNAKTQGERLTVALLGRRIVARVLEEVPYDPDNLRVRS